MVNGGRRTRRIAGAAVAVGALLAGTVVVGLGSAAAVPPPPSAGCGPVTTLGRVPLDTPKAVPDNAMTTSTITWPVGTGYVHDLDVEVRLPHTWAADLVVSLTSPSGTTVVLTSENGGSFDDVFAQTVFDDDAEPDAVLPYVGSPDLVTDNVYVNGQNEPLLVPEGALAAFDGELADGTWTLTVEDDSLNDTGTLETWAMTLSTTPTPPQWLEVKSLPPAVKALPDGTSTQNLTISGATGTIADVMLNLTISHADDAQLDVSLTSPSGTTAVLTTDNGPGADRYSSTLFHDNAPTPISDADFGAVLGSVQPEEAMSVFDGEDPNGTWVLTIVDDTAGVTGTLGSPQLWIRTGSCPPAPAPPPIDASCGSPTVAQPFAGGLPKPAPDLATTTSTITVAGTGGAIRDVDVIVGIDHARPSDLNLRLVSPSGTQIQLADGIGGLTDDPFALARFDDDADPDGSLPYERNDGIGSDGAYRDHVAAFRLTPQQALAVLDGEAANGTWTLQVQDELDPIAGTITRFGLVIQLTARTPTVFQSSWVGTGAAVPGDGVSILTRTITVSGQTLPIESLTVGVALPHPRPSDLDVVLRSPAGTSVTLTTDNGGANVDRLANAIFFDGADTSVLTDGAGVIGNARPEEPLAAFTGESANGVWTLQVRDDLVGETGSLTGWAMELFTGRCNRAPLPADDAYQASETVGVTVPAAQGVLVNDSDPDFDPLTAGPDDEPMHGTLTRSADGGFSYVPDPRYRGPDTFSYAAQDAFGGGSKATVTLTVGKPVCVPPGPFSDVTSAHPFCSEILWMANDGITKGYTDGTFKPGAVVTRQAMSAFLYRTKYPEHSPAPALEACSSPPFSDVPTNHPFCPYIQWMKTSGVGGGYPDGTFRPGATITRQAMASFLYKLENGAGAPPACSEPPFTDVPTSHPFCPQIAWMAGEGIAGGFADGTFRPGAAISRQAMAAFIERFVHRPI